MQILQLVVLFITLIISLTAEPVYVQDSNYKCKADINLDIATIACQCLEATNLLPFVIYDSFVAIDLKVTNFTSNRLTRANRTTRTLLENLNMDNNFVKTIDPETFNSMRMLVVSFANNYLSELPVNLFSNTSGIYSINFEHNLIKSLHFGFFDTMILLREIYLGNNLIGDIVDFIFSKLSLLLILDLRANYITKLTRNTFYGLYSLESLDLTENLIVNIEPFAFHSYKLASLFLANNELASLEKDSIISTSYLKELTIQTNNLKRIGARSFYNLSITTLDLSNQKILYIEDEAFKDLPSITELKIVYNQIKIFRSKWFNNLNALNVINLNINLLEKLEIDSPLEIEELSLQSNYLTSLDYKSFSNLPRLLFLDLSYNFLTEKSLGALNPLSSLGTLNLDSNRLFDFDSSELSGLKSLEYLFLKKNSIWELKASSFKNLVSLTYLDLSLNKLETIVKGTFTGLAKLSILILSYNKIKSLDENSVYGLNLINRIELEGNLIVQLGPNTFKSFRYLEELNLQFNKIDKLSFLSGCSKVKTLNLASNNINKLESSSLSSLASLETFNLDNNRLFQIEYDSFSKLKKLASLGLRNTAIESVETWNFYSISSYLTKLDLSDNMNVISNKETFFGSLKSIRSLELSGTNLTEYFFKWLPVTVRPKIEKLDLSNNNFQFDSQSLDLMSSFTSLSELNMNRIGLTDLDSIHLNNLKQLKSLFLRNNSLRVLKDKAFMAGSLSACFLQTLDLSLNKIELIEYDAFYCLKNLIILNLSHNLLSQQQPFNLVYFESLQNLEASSCSLSFMPDFGFETKLENLILDHNEIEFIKEGYFYYLNRLSYLDLSYNKIRYLDLEIGIAIFSRLGNLINLNMSNNQIDSNLSRVMHFETLTEVKHLNLSSNRIRDLSSNVFNNLEKLIDLDLSNNSLNFINSSSLHFLTNLKSFYLNKQNGIEFKLKFSSGFANGTKNVKFFYLSSVDDVVENLATFLELEPIVSKKEIVLTKGTVIRYYDSINLVTDEQPIDMNYCWLTLILIKSKLFLNLSRGKDVDNFLADCYLIEFNSPKLFY